MKINKLSVITVLALGGLAVAGSSTATAQAQQPGLGRRATHVELQMQRLTEELKLTDEQKPKVKVFLEELPKKRRELATDNRVALEDRPEKVRALINQENKKMKEILTADQFAKYQKMREQMRGGGGGGKRPAENNQERKKD